MRNSVLGAAAIFALGIGCGVAIGTVQAGADSDLGDSRDRQWEFAFLATGGSAGHSAAYRYDPKTGEVWYAEDGDNWVLKKERN